MPKFSRKSLQRLSTCDMRLQQLMHELIEIMDVSILCGHRNKQAQEEAVTNGYSKVSFPNSKHNTMPSRAVDVVPYPIDWNDKKRFHEMAGIVKGLAHKSNIKIQWGGDFKSFFDGPHFQLDDDEV